MIALSNTNVQLIPVGGSLVFNRVVVEGGCKECHRANTGSVKLRERGLYEVHFHANIGTTVADGIAELTLELGGEPLPETTMISNTESAGGLNNVSASTVVRNCCGDYDRITVVNTGDTILNIGENPVLIVHRV